MLVRYVKAFCSVDVHDDIMKNGIPESKVEKDGRMAEAFVFQKQCFRIFLSSKTFIFFDNVFVYER